MGELKILYTKQCIIISNEITKVTLMRVYCIYKTCLTVKYIFFPFTGRKMLRDQ